MSSVECFPNHVYWMPTTYEDENRNFGTYFSENVGLFQLSKNFWVAWLIQLWYTTAYDVTCLSEAIYAIHRIRRILRRRRPLPLLWSEVANETVVSVIEMCRHTSHNGIKSLVSEFPAQHQPTHNSYVIKIHLLKAMPCLLLHWILFCRFFPRAQSRAISSKFEDYCILPISSFYCTLFVVKLYKWEETYEVFPIFIRNYLFMC